MVHSKCLNCTKNKVFSLRISSVNVLVTFTEEILNGKLQVLRSAEF